MSFLLLAILLWLVLFYWTNQRKVEFSAIVEALVFVGIGSALDHFL